MNKNTHFKNTLTTVIIALGSGLIGAYAMLQFSDHRPVSLNSSQSLKTSDVVYNNTTNTTKAAKKVQDAVVSVINYRKNTGTSDDLYRQIFGGNNNESHSEEKLSIYSEGSGVIYKKANGSAYIVTNNHVIEGADSIEIMLSNGTKVVGELVGADTYSDLAVVKIADDKVSIVAEFADSDKLNVGEIAIAMGSPLGSEYANSVTQGIVSSLSRIVTLKNENGETISTNAIQTDAAINPGNSGGALINIEGQVIGINSSKVASKSEKSVEGMGFAIPANDVIKIINQLEKSGQVTRPALGIWMVDLSDLSTGAISELKIPNKITAGVVVASVQNEMPAVGKLKQYDVITAIDNKDITSASDLQSVLYGHQIGDTIKITYYRGKDKETVDVTLSKSTQGLENR
ncbi:S1C family serine protease [Streptococcus pluranimalium]|uniref:S1C family serine protease n=1 Tax=Streptococcus pluranimalium TaxID=82348 RepID=UPI0039FCA9FE